MRLTEEDLEKARRMNEHAKQAGAANSAELPLYDPLATCPKCGADALRIPAYYHHASPDLYFTYDAWAPPLKPCSMKYLAEHLCRTCGRCGYSWQERALDNVTTTAGAVHNGCA